MKYIKFLALLFILSALLCILPSCGCAAEGEVSVFYYTFSDTYISSVRSEMDSLLKGAGVFFHNYDANGNQTTQTEQIDTAIAKGSRMLIVNIVDTGSDDTARTIVEKARSANIPLIFFNRSVNEDIIKSYNRCVFVGTDYEMAGHMQGELIGSTLLKDFSKYDINGDGEISYVLFKGQQGNMEAEARTRYAIEDANKILAGAGKKPLKFYDSSNKNGYLVDQDGTWSNAAANNYMKTILSAYSERGGNMVELVIANNDEMALGAIAALVESGYNKAGGRIIPVFGIDATEAARSKIEEGFMSGTIKQDGKGMAAVIMKIYENYESGRTMLANLPMEDTVDGVRVNIPYSAYTKSDDGEK